VSGILAVAVATAWVRQFWTGDDFAFHRYGYPDAVSVEDSTVSVRLSGGGIIFHTHSTRHLVAAFIQRSAEDVREQYRPRKEFHYTRLNPLSWDNPWYPFWGRLSGSVQGTAWHDVYMCVHFAWLQALILVMPGTVLVKRIGTASRRRHGCCIRCGYDLRATPDHCPECGTTAVTDAKRPSATTFKAED
jgi:hypothetical protein